MYPYPWGSPYNTSGVNRWRQTAGQLVAGASFLPGGLCDPDDGAAALAHGDRELVTDFDDLAFTIERGGNSGIVDKFLGLPYARAKERKIGLQHDGFARQLMRPCAAAEQKSAH